MFSPVGNICDFSKMIYPIWQLLLFIKSIISKESVAFKTKECIFHIHPDNAVICE